MPYQHPYVSSYQNAFNNAVKTRALQQQFQERRAQELLRGLQMQQQAEHYRQQEALGRDRLTAQTAQRAQAVQDKAGADTEANRIVNELNPPAAQAVTPPGGDPAWEMRANAMRDKYFAAHPDLRPGPLQPYTGGQKMMPTVRPTLPSGKPDLVAAHEAQRNADIQGRTDMKDMEALQRRLSQYLPNVEGITGIDADPKSGANNGGSLISIASGGAPTTIKPPSFTPTAQNPIANMDQLLEQYRTYTAKKGRVNGASPAAASPAPVDSPASPPQSAPAAPQYQPGQTYKDANGLRARFNEDGTWTSL